MKHPCEALTEYFTRNDWSYNVDHDGRCFRSDISGESGRWRFVAMVADDCSGILFLSVLPAIVPAPRRAACVELLNLTNQDLSNGSFELVPKSGLIRFRTLLPLFEEQVDPKAVECQLAVNLLITDRHYSAIMRVTYAGLAPHQALKAPSEDNNTAPLRRFELN